MNSTKEVLTFAFVNCLGGIPSFYRNIISHTSLANKFHIRIVLVKALEDKRPEISEKIDVDEEIDFRYSITDNQFFVQRSLARLIGYEKGALITDVAIVIEATVRFKTPKTLFHLIHDFFYIHQQFKYQDYIDVSISHSSFFRDVIFAADPLKSEGKNFYLPYGVRQPSELPIKNNEILNLVFIGRLDEKKGVLLLKKIEDSLQKEGIAVNWSIIGKGHLRQHLDKQWAGCSNVKFFEPEHSAQVYNLLLEQDIFVFPTVFEGTPVSIMECMACGVVTITNDLPGGIKDMVGNDTGFLCHLNCIEDFVRCIKRLHYDRQLLNSMQANAARKVKEQFNIVTNSDNYFKLFARYQEFSASSKPILPRLPFLDRSFIPNKIVSLIRNVKTTLSGGKKTNGYMGV